MPISANAWKNELQPDDERLLSLFERKPYQAYTVSELLSKYPPTNNVLTNVARSFVLTSQLDVLVKKGLLKSKVIGLEESYISSKAV